MNVFVWIIFPRFPSHTLIQSLFQFSVLRQGVLELSYLLQEELSIFVSFDHVSYWFDLVTAQFPASHHELHAGKKKPSAGIELAGEMTFFHKLLIESFPCGV